MVTRVKKFATLATVTKGLNPKQPNFARLTPIFVVFICNLVSGSVNMETHDAHPMLRMTFRKTATI